jgi:hypothetical protein
MQCRQRPVRDVLEEGKMQEVGVEMQNVETVLPILDFVHHHKMRGEVRFQRRPIQSDRLVAHFHQLRARL